MSCEFSRDDVLDILRYEPETGFLYWLPRTFGKEASRFNSRWSGKRAGCGSIVDGYRRISLTINGVRKVHFEHRLIWFMIHGSWPIGDIDHLNHDRNDNRIENIRDVSKSDNQKNGGLGTRNKSGHIGVCWATRKKRWKVSCGSKFIGHFVDKGEAIKAAEEARAARGYHPHHGKFSPQRSQA